MIHPRELYDQFARGGLDYYVGVPDSLLKSFCAYVSDQSTDGQHMIAANEGNAIALAAGYHLASGKLPMAYMQNSGLGIIHSVFIFQNQESRIQSSSYRTQDPGF